MTISHSKPLGFPAVRSVLLGRRNEGRWWNVADAGMLAAWVALVLFQLGRHAVWRDEVRALSIALGGDDLISMLQGLHGEGHPAVWYLVLRGAYSVFGRVEVLQLVAFVIALGASSLIVFRSPFPRLLVLVLVSGRFLLHEYSVIARNYGIAALLLFVIAACYRRYRDQGVVLGVLLFLLANTNVVATIMAGVFLLFWLLELLDEDGFVWTPKVTNLLVNGVIAAAGAAVCALTILPTFNDAAARDWSEVSPIGAAIGAIWNPGGTTLGALLPQSVPALLVTLLLFASTAGLAPRRPAFVAAVVALLLGGLFFAVAANGYYRHAAIWLCFLIALYWIAWEDVVASGRIAFTPGRLRGITLGGLTAFVVLLGAQSLRAAVDVRDAAAGEVKSRSADLARFVSSRTDLADAVILGEPDFLAEPIPYYLPNRTYLLRERRFGSIPKFTRSGRLHVDLGELLSVARDVRAESAAPVLILLAHRLDEIVPGRVYREGYNWTFRAGQDEIDAFLASVTLLQRFGPAERETFDLYLLE